MRAIIAAGGTAGHINPAIAIAQEIRKREPDSDILFVGRGDGMENRLVPEAGYPMFPMEMHGFSRSFTIKGLWFNLQTLRHVYKAEQQAGKLFSEFRPDIVIGCGGYVSGPIVRKAAKQGIPTAIQEQNSFPGLTTKLLAKDVGLVMVANEDALARIKTNAKCVVVGNPVRDEFFSANRTKLRRDWRIGEMTCIVSFGGSLGARTINELSAKLMSLHCKTNEIFHIHATGQYGTKLVPELLKSYQVPENSPNIRISEYITNMAECFAAADLIISRAGAITVSEITASGRASVLIPSPNVTENHQYYNAKSLEKVGAALLIEEHHLQVEQSAEEIYRLATDKQRLKTMGVQARSMAIPNSANRIYEQIKKLI